MFCELPPREPEVCFHYNRIRQEAVPQLVLGDAFVLLLGQGFGNAEGTATDRHEESESPEFMPNKDSLPLF